MTIDDCTHCYHGTGVALMSNPPKSEEKCCWCGKKRYLTLHAAIQDEGDHGPHHTGLF